MWHLQIPGVIHWQPGIGDPTVIGWLTTVCYFAAAYLCARAARAVAAQPADSRQGSALFWAILAVLLAGLGFNKQLDLQSLLTNIGREVARSQGWYEQRRGVQELFIAFTMLAGTGLLAFFCVLIRKSLARQGLALLGMVFLACFIVIRASSFHHVDYTLHLRFAGMKLYWILELGGIALVMVSAARNAGRNRQKQ
ncbi:MAG TPA: hypothetical protein VM186_15245 [Planctomycetota bacterium]|nr:hypothetical protein [Planctomycetota bacterium]